MIPIKPLMSGVVESGLNFLIHQTPTNQNHFARLKGKVIAVHFQELKEPLFFVFSHQLDVLACYEGEVDCYVSLDVATLLKLQDQNQATALIKQDLLVLEGDLQLAQDFSKFLLQIKPNLEEFLSLFLADVPAYQIAYSMKSIRNWFVKKQKESKLLFNDALIHEWKISPSPLEIAYFNDEIEQVENKVDTLLERLDLLVTQLGKEKIQ